jgi:putative flippase GtrA
MVPLARQFAAFSGVGLAAAAIHYGALILIVQTDFADPVRANLAAYVLGGIVSYSLNRQFAFRSERPHSHAVWRFAVVAGVGFVLTGVLTYWLHRRLGLPYVLAAVMTSGVVLFWSFIANRLWTFPDAL